LLFDSSRYWEANVGLNRLPAGSKIWECFRWSLQRYSLHQVQAQL
jgi:hypothetical protein